jgi:hypothetical protein
MRTGSRIRTLTLTLCALGLAILPPSGRTPAQAQTLAPSAPRPVIQLAILLDTSGSMDGLINQARTQLWSIVNEFTKATRDGRSPELQIALYEYGNDGLPAAEGYLRQVLPLTTDLDKVSEKLFALTTNGGSEFCGQVIDVATRRLVWDPASATLKTIFIAGNEPFTQGGVDFRQACKGAITKGITVNTIHCGGEQDGANSGWKDGALLGEGTYMAIDQGQQTVAIPAPQDAELARLNAALNATYLAFGPQGSAGQTNQVAQDRNAMQASPSVAAARAATKATANYSNATWDLVDATREGKVKVAELKAEELPAPLQKLTPAERQAYIEKQAAERTRLQGEIGTLAAARAHFIAAERKKHAGAGTTLESAILTAVRQHATKQGYLFGEGAGPSAPREGAGPSAPREGAGPSAPREGAGPSAPREGAGPSAPQK